MKIGDSRPPWRRWIAVLVLVGAVTAAAQPTNFPYKAVATTGMIGDLVREIGAGHAGVTTLIGTGIDPHLYKPTRSDVVRLGTADIIFYHGLMLEGAMGHVLDRVAKDGKRPVLAVGDRVMERGNYTVEGERTGGDHDPHIWMDVAGWIEASEVIAETLAAWDPANATLYHANQTSLSGRLRELDDYARESIATIPAARRVLVTAHDAFRYFGRAYEIEVRGIQGISTESEAGIRDIGELVDFLVERKIPAVFVETSVADRNIRALIEGSRARGHEVIIGGTLFSDSMGAPGTYEGTFTGMIDHNVTTVVRALGGTAPEGGFQGLLKAEAD